MPKYIAPHVTALISAVGGVIALVHPGFTVPPFVQGLVTSLAILVGAGVELIHLAQKNTLAANLAAIAKMAEKVPATVATSAPAPAPTPAPAPEPAPAPAPEPPVNPTA